MALMDGTYFVPRTELLGWLNNLLGLNYTKVEQCASGAAHCQVMDALFPGKVPLHKVNFKAKLEYEYINNFKILQQVFDQNGVEKPIDVAKLIKAKYLDNLEFLQWMKSYFDQHYTGGEYNGAERRNEASKGGTTVATTTAAVPAAKPATTAAGTSDGATASTEPAETPTEPSTTASTVPTTASARTATASRVTAAPTVRTTTTTKPTTTTAAAARAPVSTARSPATTATRPTTAASTTTTAAARRTTATTSATTSRISTTTPRTTTSAATKPAAAVASQQTAELEAKVAELTKSLADVTVSSSAIVKERDFYFNTLQAVEAQLQVFEGVADEALPSARDLIKQLFEIIYRDQNEDDSGATSATPQASGDQAAAEEAPATGGNGAVDDSSVF